MTLLILFFLLQKIPDPLRCFSQAKIPASTTPNTATLSTYFRTTKTTMMSTKIFLRATRAGVSPTVVTKFSGGKKASGVLLGVASSLILPGSTVALCESKDNGFLESITKKDKDGNTDWAGTASQVTSSDFWDKVAAASGEKVSNMDNYMHEKGAL